jgi:hypothetical protein
LIKIIRQINPTFSVGIISLSQEPVKENGRVCLSIAGKNARMVHGVPSGNVPGTSPVHIAVFIHTVILMTVPQPYLSFIQHIHIFHAVFPPVIFSIQERSIQFNIMLKDFFPLHL